MSALAYNCCGSVANESLTNTDDLAKRPVFRNVRMAVFDRTDRRNGRGDAEFLACPRDERAKACERARPT